MLYRQSVFQSVLLGMSLLPSMVQAQPGVTPTKAAKVNKQGMGKLILRRMVKAEMAVSFLAREVRIERDGHSTEQWVKRDPKLGLRRESIQPPGTLLVDNRRRQFLVQPAMKRYTEMKSQLAELHKHLAEVMRADEGALVVELQGQDTIAGRGTDVVLVHPAPGAEGPSRRFWVDRETGLRLRTEERAPNGRILSNTYYLSLELSPSFRPDDFSPPPVPVGFRPVVDNQKRYDSIEAAAREGVVVRQPGWLPSGFRLRRITTQGANAPVNVQWGNDMTALSLVSAQGGIPPILRKILAGANSGFGQLPNGERVYAWKASGGYFMLIGNLPDEQVKRIADSVR